MLQSARRLQQYALDAIALACTGMSTVGMMSYLENRIKINVIDPVLAEATIALFKTKSKRWNVNNATEGER